MADTAAASAGVFRLAPGASLDPARKAALGQFLTPAPIAKFMASLFQRWPDATRVLDAGAGAGALSEAFAFAFSARAPSQACLELDAYEIEPAILPYLSAQLASIQSGLEARGHHVTVNIKERDFLREASYAASFSRTVFSHAILNPPYKKIGTRSEYRRLLRELGIETTNLYAAFLALAVALTEESGEIVAIVPRSFCNGPYFRQFRSWLLQRVAIKRIHVFESRRKPFSGDGVLQENVIVHLVRDGQQSDVTVSISTDATFDDFTSLQVPFSQIVRVSDPEKFIHVPITTLDQSALLLTHTLTALGLDVSTGPVVDFRVRESWLTNPTNGSVPLLYAHHFSSGRFEWPRHHKKPNALLLNSQTRKWLMPRGWYVIVKRFSAKEERKRVVAFVVDPNSFNAAYLGFENHLNVIHCAKQGIPRELARGLSLFLNSTLFDQHFRSFSGHTQVNATDLRTMKYPNAALLRRFGRWAEKQGQLPQEEIDSFLSRFIDDGAGAPSAE